MLNKNAVSPIISTVLLIMIVIVLAFIILLWSRGFIKEAITKEVAGKESSVNKLCQEIQIRPVINEDDTFGFENTGNIPIYAYNIKLSAGGSSETIKISKEEGGSVNPGFTAIVDRDKIGGRGYSNFQGEDEGIKIIPVLLGRLQNSNSNQEFPCPDENGFII
ncbi:MAG: archaellin/type IV pilin N-terminal domain-containing protein [Nanoarchaeota archaeon]